METELKFQIPAQALSAVQRALATKTARSLALQARYVDTPDGALAAGQLALRLRREGGQWVQTVKAPGTSAVVRLEHEVVLDPADDDPHIDITRHAGTPAGQALAQAVGDGAASLKTVFETRIVRTLRLVRHAGAVIEVALDVGELIAGDQHAPVCELEFELKRGSVAALVDLCERWVQRHGLWLDVRSKAERGLALAHGVSELPLVLKKQPALTLAMSHDTALRTLVANCLAQVLPQAARVADAVDAPEALHQLRVGLRRLRCALRVFGDKSGAIGSDWEPALAALFDRLGSSRDQDVFAQTVYPALRAAGAPLAELPTEAQRDDPAAAVRSVASTTLLLELLGFAHGATEATPDDPRPAQPGLVDIVYPRLRRLRRQLRADAEAFPTLDDASRHRSRKRLKRWRYALEFAAAFYTARSVKRCLTRVRAAQEILGRYNDLVVAEQAFRALAERDPLAWFAVGWLSASREPLVPQAHAALLDVSAAASRLKRRKGTALSAPPTVPKVSRRRRG